MLRTLVLAATLTGMAAQAWAGGVTFGCSLAGLTCVGTTGAVGATGATGAGATGATGLAGATGATGASPWLLNGADTYYTAGKVGVGTTNPTQLLHVKDNQNSNVMMLLENVSLGTQAQTNIRSINNIGTISQLGIYGTNRTAYGAISANEAYVYGSAPALVLMADNASGIIKLATGGAGEKVRINASGNVGIGTTDPGHTLTLASINSSALFNTTGASGTLSTDAITYAGSYPPPLATVSSDYDALGPVFISNRATSSGVYMSVIKTRTSRPNTDADTVVASGDNILTLKGGGADGTLFRDAASITMDVDATPGTSDMPGRITFNTTPDGSATLAERMRITNGGNVGIGTTNPTAKLHISTSGIYAVEASSGIKITGGSNAGYTFQDGSVQYTAAAGVSWPLLAPNGLATAPSYSFTNDATIGIYYKTGGGARGTFLQGAASAPNGHLRLKAQDFSNGDIAVTGASSDSTSYGSTPGNVTLSAGTETGVGSVNTGGHVDLHGGNSTAAGGSINILAGNGASGDGGDIYLTPGTGTTRNGVVIVNGVMFGGTATSAQIQATACTTYPGQPCTVYNSDENDWYNSTGTLVGQWRNNRTGVGP